MARPHRAAPPADAHGARAQLDRRRLAQHTLLADHHQLDGRAARPRRSGEGEGGDSGHEDEPRRISAPGSARALGLPAVEHAVDRLDLEHVAAASRAAWAAGRTSRRRSPMRKNEPRPQRIGRKRSRLPEKYEHFRPPAREPQLHRAQPGRVGGHAAAQQPRRPAAGVAPRRCAAVRSSRPARSSRAPPAGPEALPGRAVLQKPSRPSLTHTRRRFERTAPSLDGLEVLVAALREGPDGRRTVRAGDRAAHRRARDRRAVAASVTFTVAVPPGRAEAGPLSASSGSPKAE